jgi:class 3 adenylate cyclase
VSVTDVGRRSPAVRTFLIADIRGYTPFAAREGDQAASELALRFAAICGEAIQAWDGELVELRGDEALAAFDSPRHALRCAVELQDAFYHETNVDPSLPLKVGIGLDAGEAVPLADGYRGTALNVAARLSALAQAGQTLASADVTRQSGGDMLVFSIDASELLDIVAQSLSRGFTADECDRYEFTPCPSLAELQGQSPTP